MGPLLCTRLRTFTCRRRNALALTCARFVEHAVGHTCVLAHEFDGDAFVVRYTFEFTNEILDSL